MVLIEKCKTDTIDHFSLPAYRQHNIIPTYNIVQTHVTRIIVFKMGKIISFLFLK